MLSSQLLPSVLWLHNIKLASTVYTGFCHLDVPGFQPLFGLRWFSRTKKAPLLGAGLALQLSSSAAGFQASQEEMPGQRGIC